MSTILPAEPEKCIGVYGGSFDPIHHGHLRSALEVKQHLSLSELRLMPSGNPPHRERARVSSEHRKAMLKLAVANTAGLVIDSRELERDQPSYTIDTLELIQQEMPRTALTLVMGMDQFSTFETWHRWQELLQRVRLAVMERPGEPLSASAQQILAGEFGKNINIIKVTQLEISSSRIRAELEQQRDIRFLLPLAVRNYILQHGLYQDL